MRADWRMFAAVALGGAVGSVARFALTWLVQSRVTGPFPIGTLVVNIAGSLVLGFIMQLGLATASMSPHVRLLLTTGFCGGFTTFSAFSYETAQLINERKYSTTAVYIGASVVLSLIAIFVGMRLARGVLPALRPNGSP